MKPKRSFPTPSKSNLLPLKPISNLPATCLQLPAHTSFCFLLAPNRTTDQICQEPSRLNATQTLDMSPSFTGLMGWGLRMVVGGTPEGGRPPGEGGTQEDARDVAAISEVQVMILQGTAKIPRAQTGEVLNPAIQTLMFYPIKHKSPWAILNRHADSQDFSFSPLGRQWGKGSQWKSPSCPLGNLSASRVAVSPKHHQMPEDPQRFPRAVHTPDTVPQQENCH